MGMLLVLVILAAIVTGIYISGKDYDEINKKFQSLPIFSFEALDNDADFCDLIAAERVDDDSWDVQQ